MSLYKEKNYLISVPYIFNQYIREYDISKANINILLAKGVIDNKLYNQLSNSDRMVRQVYIGKMIRSNPQIQEVLNQGIIEYKKMLFESNGITDNDIISIKNDAVFILNKIPTITKFGNVEFVHRNTYTAYMKLYSLEIYYGNELYEEVIDIKGIKDEDLEMYHYDFLGIIIDFLRHLQKDGSQVAFNYINYIIYEYVERRLPISIYRRFSSSNDYVLKVNDNDFGVMYLTDDKSNKNSIDISHNLGILRLMHQYVSQLLYEEKMRK